MKAILDDSDDSISDSEFSDDNDVELYVVTAASGAYADAIPAPASSIAQILGLCKALLLPVMMMTVGQWSCQQFVWQSARNDIPWPIYTSYREHRHEL